MSRFTILDTPIADLKIVERQQLGDNRGFLSRLFCAEELAAAGWHKPVAQINQTHTQKQATIRGLHYQRPPQTEMKLVICLSGVIWDVAVDLRAGSPTYLQWHAEELSSDNHRALLIPEGFAHGFQTLSDDVELIYCHSAVYAAEAEMGLRFDDPVLHITWPLESSALSSRDNNHPLLTPNFAGVIL